MPCFFEVDLGLSPVTRQAEVTSLNNFLPQQFKSNGMSQLNMMLGALVVLVGLLLWLWRKLTVRRISPKGKTFVVTGAASGFGKEGATHELSYMWSCWPKCWLSSNQATS